MKIWQAEILSINALIFGHIILNGDALLPFILIKHNIQAHVAKTFYQIIRLWCRHARSASFILVGIETVYPGGFAWVFTSLTYIT